MRAKVVRIGNSRGVRIPKALLEQVGIGDSVEMTVEDGRLVLQPGPRHPREGWSEEARRSAELGEDRLIDPEIPTEFDLTEWEW